jgi:hypothetical protein
MEFVSLIFRNYTSSKHMSLLEGCTLNTCITTEAKDKQSTIMIAKLKIKKAIGQGACCAKCTLLIAIMHILF